MLRGTRKLASTFDEATKHFKVHHRSNRVIFNSRGISNHVNSVSRNELLVELNIKFPENVSATTRLNANSYRCVKVIVSSSDALPATLFAIVCLTFSPSRDDSWNAATDGCWAMTFSSQDDLESCLWRALTVVNALSLQGHGEDFLFIITALSSCSSLLRVIFILTRSTVKTTFMTSPTLRYRSSSVRSYRFALITTPTSALFIESSARTRRKDCRVVSRARTAPYE